MSSGFDYALLDRILEAHDCAPRNTIAILQDVQEHYHYLPQEAFPYMAKRLNVGEARLYSVATFPSSQRGNTSSRFATAPPAM